MTQKQSFIEHPLNYVNIVHLFPFTSIFLRLFNAFIPFLPSFLNKKALSYGLKQECYHKKYQ